VVGEAVAGEAAVGDAVADALGMDRFGLGWRPELAVSIHRCLDCIDVLEFIADDWLNASEGELESLRSWCRLRPSHLHGLGMGMASAVPLEKARLDQMARLVAAVRPERWSEHLSFVRGGGIELGHLAAPPRSRASIAGGAMNIRMAMQAVGSRPLMENVATLIDPPGSTIAEPEWLNSIILDSDADFLLDLHNLHANAVNFGFDARAALDRLPIEKVAAIHLSGGRWIGRLLDDHLHDPPDDVFALLESVAERSSRPLDIIIERDGRYPPIARLCEQLERARACVAAGRRRARDHELTRS
jgi:uncharacterized protein (UPF0276 family)